MNIIYFIDIHQALKFHFEFCRFNFVRDSINALYTHTMRTYTFPNCMVT